MHVALDLRCATPHFPGIGRYARDLAEAMTAACPADARLTLLVASSSSVESGNRVRIDASPFSLAQQFTIPRRLRAIGADVYFSPYYLMPYRPGVPALVTVCDLIPLQYPQGATPQARAFFAPALRMALRAARGVVTISEATRDELIRFAPRYPSIIRCIPPAASEHFRPAPESALRRVRERYALPEAFALCMGSAKPHKNIARLRRAWPSSDLPLTLTGPDGIGFVPDEDLPALYSAARLFVLPSLYEGFGLPLLEAMRCGTPCLCSGIPALREVGGDAAVYFDPRDPKDMGDRIGSLIKDETLRAERSRASLRRAQDFSWADTARRTWSFCREILNGTRDAP